MSIKFVVLGGDKRSLELVRLLGVDDHNVRNLVKPNSENISFEKNEIVIGPLPFSHDNDTLNAPYYDNDLMIEDLIKLLTKDQYFFGGKINDKYLYMAKEYRINLIDYFKREEIQVLNAIPTAEGAIKVAMDNLLTTIHNSNVLILGYGRIGKALANLANNMGANTYVAARSVGDLASIENLRYYPIKLKNMDKELDQVDIIFNTIPALVLNKEYLNNLRKDTLIIDLASKPGGVDCNRARQLGLNVNHALGLPGKYAPVTAAKTIKETIYNIIDERGI